MSLRPALSLITIALALTACKSNSPTSQADNVGADGAAAVAAATPAPADATAGDAQPNDNLNAVLWVQRAAEYRAVSQTVYRAAADHLDAALKEKNWDALAPEERANAANGLPAAVVMDVDETVLDNSPYQARLVRDGKDYDEVTWALWVAEKKAKAVPGVVDFAKAASAKGITLLYLSNRAIHLKDATIANLKAVGMPVKDDGVFLGLGTFVKDCEQNGTEKNCRRKLAGKQYRVLMQFGDQLGDFVQIIANSPEGRDALYEQYKDWFGERWWMLPGPTYGSWEPAMFNNAWEQSLAERRKAKLDALDLAK